MSKEVELKRCPFCGSGNINFVVDNAEYALGLIDETDVKFKLICSISACGCGASSGWYDSREEVIKRWNARKDSDVGLYDDDKIQIFQE